MDITMIVLRLFHIFAGVFWVGAGLMAICSPRTFTQFAGEEGKRFGQRFMSQSKYGMFMGIASMLTVLSGALMYWRVSKRVSVDLAHVANRYRADDWRACGHSGACPGNDCSFADGCAIVGVGQRDCRGGRNAQHPAQAQTLGQLQARIAKANTWSAIFLITATIGMAIARYV